MSPSSAITIEELLVGDPPEAWTAAGFRVDPDGVVRVGRVRIRLAGRAHGKGILGWRLAGIDPAGLDHVIAGSPAPPDDGPLPGTAVDGIRTAVAAPGDGEPAEHPNRVVAIDHVVLLTPATGRTTAALAGIGLDARRTRETDQYGLPMLQTFFRAGPVIVELIGPPDPMGDGPTGWFGVAYTVDDLDGTAAVLGDHLGRAKDAVQQGRRIATLRHRDLGLSVATAFMTPG